MRTARIRGLVRLTSLPDQDPGRTPVYKVRTDWAEDDQNSFYMEYFDSNGRSVSIPSTPEGSPDDPDMLNWGDEIIFDKQDGLLRKCVMWRGRKFRQKGYSFDDRLS